MATRKKSRAGWSSIARLLTAACLAGSMSAQNRPQHVGMPDDWSHRHLIFSNAGTNVQMLEQRETRFRLQQAKRNRARVSPGWNSTPATAGPHSESMQAEPTLQRDWNMDLGAEPTEAMYPAKFTFDVNATPDCEKDFVVFPIGNFAAVGLQAKLIAFNNLYRPGLCGTATTPSFKFAYQIGTGVVHTSPVLSLDGTKIAFVESRTSVTDFPNFHVLTIGTTGTNGDSTQGVAVGVEGGNNAVDTFVQMFGGNSVTRSSPFVDYEADVAYVGDDHGNLHQFTGVFRGTLAEVIDGNWPVSLGADTILTSPVFFNDNIFFGAANGRLYCVTKGGAGCFPISSIAVGTEAILDAPIVDGSTGRIFVATQNALNSILVQVPTSLENPIAVSMGNPPPDGFHIHNGAFDHNYLTGADPSAGFMYFCGVASNGNAPTLYRVGFNAIGRVNDTRDAISTQLHNKSGDKGECSPLTEIYNPSTPGGPTDLLFVTMAYNKKGCMEFKMNCIGSLDITSRFPVAFHATFELGGSGEGTSAIVVDNVADVASVYFADVNDKRAYRLTQLGLQ